MNYIEVKELNVKLHNSIILENFSASFEKGKISGIIGRNGSGKTILLKSICGLIPINNGQIFIDNTLVSAGKPLPTKVGIMIESPGFLPGYSAYQNLKFLADINRKITKDDICLALDKVGLNPKSHVLVRKYSMGMKQRLGIAQAIMEDPDLLVLDEPMNSLDVEGVNRVRNLLLDLKARKKTIIMTSHIKDDVDILCDSVIEIQDHKVK